MPIDIVPGTIMMRVGLLLPGGMNTKTDRFSKKWDVVTGPDSFSMDRSLRAVGWNFFFTAAALHVVTFGRREKRNVTLAVKRILSRVLAQDFNCVEITEIEAKHFLGIPYTTVCAHARHIQQGLTLLGPHSRRQVQHAADWASQ